MAINKLHDEFHTLDMNAGWEVPAGYPSGIQQKILSGALDEKRAPRPMTPPPCLARSSDEHPHHRPNWPPPLRATDHLIYLFGDTHILENGTMTKR